MYSSGWALKNNKLYLSKFLRVAVNLIVKEPLIKSQYLLRESKLFTPKGVLRRSWPGLLATCPLAEAQHSGCTILSQLNSVLYKACRVLVFRCRINLIL